MAPRWRAAGASTAEPKARMNIRVLNPDVQGEPAPECESTGRLRTQRASSISGTETAFSGATTEPRPS
jgi:hypothetical protein